MAPTSLLSGSLARVWFVRESQGIRCAGKGSEDGFFF